MPTAALNMRVKCAWSANPAGEGQIGQRGVFFAKLAAARVEAAHQR